MTPSGSRADPRAWATREPPTAVVDLSRGGKITSLIGAGVEWLLQPDGRPPQDSSFVGSGLSGWDECIPTITASVSAEGKPLPDHGSVWSVPWRSSGGGSAIVEADQFKLARRISNASGELLVEYTLQSTASSTITVLWAAHPQITAPAGTFVELDLPGAEVVEVHPGPARVRPWDEVNRIDSVRPGTSRKVYLPLTERVSGARLCRADGRWLAFRWDPQLVPHLGVWFDAADYASHPVIAVEPAIGWYDDLAVAAANGTAMHLEPGETRSWWLSLTAGRDRSGPQEG